MILSVSYKICIETEFNIVPILKTRLKSELKTELYHFSWKNHNLFFSQLETENQITFDQNVRIKIGKVCFSN
jgi:hypothetical protein